MKNIIVLCTGNSCRSQIAEGYLKQFANGKASIFSAGLEVHGLNRGAITVMQEDGVDISHQTSNSINDYAEIEFDYVITVCDHAREHCPFIPGVAQQLHHDFPDPAKATGTEEEIMGIFRQVRDQIKEYCRNFVLQYL